LNKSSIIYHGLMPYWFCMASRNASLDASHAYLLLGVHTTYAWTDITLPHEVRFHMKYAWTDRGQ
jgi:hypothetical protein